MSHKLYPKPTPSQRIKLALHYLTPQHTLTRLAGWIANQQWGAATQFIIKQFARAYKINWQEAAQPNPSDYPTFNQFFTRALKDGARPIVAGDNQIALPADGARKPKRRHPRKPTTASQRTQLHAGRPARRRCRARRPICQRQLHHHLSFPPRLPPRAHALRRHPAPNDLRPR